jgi:hypothetical protein
MSVNRNMQSMSAAVHDLTEAKVRDAMYKCLKGMDLATMSYKLVWEGLNNELKVDILMWKDKSVLKEMIQEVAEKVRKTKDESDEETINEIAGQEKRAKARAAVQSHKANQAAKKAPANRSPVKVKQVKKVIEKASKKPAAAKKLKTAEPAAFEYSEALCGLLGKTAEDLKPYSEEVLVRAFREYLVREGLKGALLGDGEMPECYWYSLNPKLKELFPKTTALSSEGKLKAVKHDMLNALWRDGHLTIAA